LKVLKLLHTHLQRATFHASRLLPLCLFLLGCASPAVSTRPFDFTKDTFSYTNELFWVYKYDPSGKWTTEWRDPKPTYAQHCFVVARSAQQFFRNARFDPTQPGADDATYRRLIRKVVSSNPRQSRPDAEKIVIPGYPHLRAFSEAKEKLLKKECGGAWQSYFQLSHWRMIFPFSRCEQARMCKQLQEHLDANHSVVIHLVRFPQLTINHAMVLFDWKQIGEQIEFAAYDPNQPEKPTSLFFDTSKRSFILPANHYFPGGRLDVYEIYHRWNY